MSISRHIPNALTCLNLLSGASAIVLVAVFHPFVPLYYAYGLLVLAAFFDLLDGLVARALKATSPIGKDLDSLADVISFGLAPAIMLYVQLRSVAEELVGDPMAFLPIFLLCLPALFIAVFAALRLARFNNDPRQSTSFHGLPVPAAALFVLGILPSNGLLEGLWLMGLGATQALVAYYLLVALTCYMMVSDVPMFSFKLRGGSLGDYIPQIILLLVGLVSIFFLGWFGFSITILAYVLLSFIQSQRHRSAKV